MGYRDGDGVWHDTPDPGTQTQWADNTGFAPRQTQAQNGQGAPIYGYQDGHAVVVGYASDDGTPYNVPGGTAGSSDRQAYNASNGDAGHYDQNGQWVDDPARVNPSGAFNDRAGYIAPRNSPMDRYATHDNYVAGRDDTLWGNVVQPSAYEYGQEIGGDKAEEARYAGLAGAADARQAAQINNLKYNLDRSKEGYSSDEQQYGLDQYRNMIEGKGPSVAEQQMGLGLAQAQQNNANALQAAQQAAASRAASARGGGANLAAAQMQAAQQQGGAAAAANQTNAQIGQQAAFQGGMLRAQEQQQALGGYSALSSQKRANDLQREGMSADQAYKQATLEEQQRALNDARNAQYENRRQQVFESQDANRQAGEAANAGVYGRNEDRKQKSDQANADRTQQYIGAGTAAAGALGAAAIMSDISAKQGIGSGDVAVRNQFGVLGQTMPSAAQGRGLGLAQRGLPAPQAPAATAPSPGAMSQPTTPQYTPPSMRVGSGQQLGGLPAPQQPAMAPMAPRLPAPQQPIAPNQQSAPQGLGRLAQQNVMSDTRAKTNIGDGRDAARAQLTAAVDPDLYRKFTPDYLAAHPELQSQIRPGYLSPAQQRALDDAEEMRRRREAWNNPAAPRPPRAVSDQLSVMKPNTYRYKEPQKHGEGERIGVMAQDMEKGPYGHQLVKDTPEGKKIDGAGGLSLALAGTADHEKRLRAIEAAGGAPGFAVKRLADTPPAQGMMGQPGDAVTPITSAAGGGTINAMLDARRRAQEEEARRAALAQQGGLALAAGQ